MSLTDMRAEILDAVYEDLSDPAMWNDVPASVRTHAPDDLIGMGLTQVVVTAMVISVRKSEVAQPNEGDTVSIGVLDDDGVFTPTAIYRVVGTPRLNARGEWVCGAAAA